MIPITEVGLCLHPWGLGVWSPQPSPALGHSSVQRPPPRQCINTSNIETFSSKYLFLGRTPEVFCFVSIVQNGFALYLLRHRGGRRMCENQGMPPSFVLPGGTFRVQHCLVGQLEGRAAQIGEEEEHGTSPPLCRPVLAQIPSRESENHI